ncbi:hypothetical protein [Pseudomonas nitroreducens]|uniref:hypothetical protein n=1 Tax=Pseudomonas nitroreducens TaxID=46680 RepID=UPI00351D2C3F
MSIIGIGRWEFELPEEWEQQEQESGVPYFETQDGTKGCYIKGISFGQPQASYEAAAQYLQQVHERNILADPKAYWTVVERFGAETANGFLARLDLLDKTRAYRVLSVVLANRSEALQVTLHDYDCQDYEASLQAFAAIADSLRCAETDT